MAKSAGGGVEGHRGWVQGMLCSHRGGWRRPPPEAQVTWRAQRHGPGLFGNGIVRAGGSDGKRGVGGVRYAVEGRGPGVPASPVRLLREAIPAVVMRGPKTAFQLKPTGIVAPFNGLAASTRRWISAAGVSFRWLVEGATGVGVAAAAVVETTAGRPNAASLTTRRRTMGQGIMIRCEAGSWLLRWQRCEQHHAPRRQRKGQPFGQIRLL